jgi:tRNA pseudouridine55 synthase
MTHSKTKTRKINGLLLLDKPTGISSNTALQEVKRIFQAQKAGHTGSLDPLASGMLPICLGEATKFSQYLLTSDKIYQVTGKFGIRTTTGDREGEIVKQSPPPPINKHLINELFTAFLGKSTQIPTMFSALKHKGQPLYKLARQGIEVERPARPIEINSLELIDFTADEITFVVKCSKGTYIRTLIEDMGEKLGCGAHVSALRRMNAAHFQAKQMISLDKLSVLADKLTELDKLLLHTGNIVTSLPEFSISEASLYYLKNGQTIISPFNTPPEGLVKLTRQDGTFIGIGKVLPGERIAASKIMQE